MGFAVHPASAQSSPPKLLVVISIDQFGSDLFNEYRGRFKHGLKRLHSGIVYSNAYYAHGVTETCAGHAVILSGRHPNATGIIANNWYDYGLAKDRYCTDDEKNVAAIASRPLGVGPGLFQVSTLGDWLKAEQPKARVFAVAGKDRSAIMMAGHNTDGAYWFDGKKSFDTWGADKVQATDRLKVLATINTDLAKRLAKSVPTWTYKNKMCRSAEQSITLSNGQDMHAHLPPDPPAPIPGRPASATAPIPPWFYDQTTLDAAYSIAQTQKLGKGDTVDILAISLSGTDMVGHAYGTQGPEMCDHLSRLDEDLGKFLDRMGKLKLSVVYVVTADHGGADFVERLAMRGYPTARRVDATEMMVGLNKAVQADLQIDWEPLKAAFFDPSRLSIVDSKGGFISDQALRARVEQTTINHLRKRSDVVDVWTGADLNTHKITPLLLPDAYSLKDRLALSYSDGRTGDIIVAFDPLMSLIPPLPGLILTGHASPYDYNRRVPILIWQDGLKAEERTLPVEVVDLAPTLSRLINVTPKADVDGRCLEVAQLGLRCGQ